MAGKMYRKYRMVFEIESEEQRRKIDRKIKKKIEREKIAKEMLNAFE